MLSKSLTVTAPIGAGYVLYHILCKRFWRATSYSVVSYSAWCSACDPCMFPQEKSLTVSWRASTCCLGCLFSSSVLCFSTDFFLHIFPPSAGSFYDDFFPLLHFSAWSPSYISVPLFSIFFCLYCFVHVSSPSLILSQCSVSCGGGVQTRSVQCLRQGRPAAGCLPHQRPVTSRACNTHFCPASVPAPAHRPSWVTAAGPTLKGKGQIVSSLYIVPLVVVISIPFTIHWILSI